MVTFDDLIAILAIIVKAKVKKNDNKVQLYVIFFLTNKRYIDVRNKAYLKINQTICIFPIKLYVHYI